ncbi:MAG TPA: glycosyltransferase [Gemmatimonadaceae bacterium]|nr:glycosyltransferase [Gemmatimonadaceae bacterium]
MPTPAIMKENEPASLTPVIDADAAIPDTAFRDAIPKLGRGEEIFMRAFATVAWLYGLYWVIWRWTYSLNPDSLIFSVVLIVAETYGLFNSFMLIATVWKLNYRESPPTPNGLSVDVFITNYDEPLEVLRRTAIGARAIKYPHKTWMLDDGKREEVKAMAEALGIGYIRREGNASAKAGNLNNALKVTTGEFILQLDADHVPLPNILHRLLGYFEDEKVAFVQSPQDFYNTDSFTHVINEEGRSLWEENRIFFSLLQPGKDSWNAAFFCGSCGVLRRKAFDDIGGFSTRTITEDMETSIVLHGRGWKSVYHGETLAYGLAPSSAFAYHVQRLRWGQGSMQILRKLNPLIYPGLTIPQRIAYLSSTATYLDGIQKLIFYLAPVVFFFTGWLPVNVTNAQLVTRLIPYVLLSIISFELMSRGTGWILISERYNMAKFWTYIKTYRGFFTNKPIKFNVTPKGSSDVPFETYAPQLVLLIVSLASVVFATFAYHFGWVDYHAPGWSSLAFWLNGFWIGWNVYFAGFVVLQSRASKQQRVDHRFIDAFPIIISATEKEGVPKHDMLALTQDLNPSGMAFRAAFAIPVGARVQIPLPLASGTYEVSGHVMHVEKGLTGNDAIFTHGVQFEDTPLETRDAIELHCTHHSVPMWRMKYRQSVNLFSKAVEMFANIRGERRYFVQLPARVLIEDEDGGPPIEGLALLEDVSARGARLLMEIPVAPARRLSFEVPGTSFSGKGHVIFNRVLESPMKVRFVVGIGRDPRQSWLKTWTREWRSLALPTAEQEIPS